MTKAKRLESAAAHPRSPSNRWETIKGSLATAIHSEPGNKGKIVGQEAPSKLKDIWALRARLQMENRVRELALFNLGIASKLRSCDLDGIKARDLCHGDEVASRAVVMQHKTERPVSFEITPATRHALEISEQTELRATIRSGHAVCDAPARQLFEVRVAPGSQAGPGPSRRSSASTGPRMTLRVPGAQRVCRDQDPHQQVDQRTRSSAQRQQREQQPTEPALKTGDACDAAAHATQPAVVATAAQRIDRRQGRRGDLGRAAENARLGAREFLVRQHAALVKATELTQFLAQTHDASPNDTVDRACKIRAAPALIKGSATNCGCARWTCMRQHKVGGLSAGPRMPTLSRINPGLAAGCMLAGFGSRVATGPQLLLVKIAMDPNSPLIADFLSARRLAVAGVSRSANQPANAILRRLRDGGYDVIAINPHADQLENTKCYPDLAAVPGVVDGLMVVVPPAAAESLVRQAAALGITRIWFHRSFGDGSVSEAALKACTELGIRPIVGGCPLMVCPPVDVAHRCMRWWLSRRGRIPV